MKTRLTILIVLLFSFVALETTFAQETRFNFIGSGARARGMGGAFIGVADDATAISWNPAGLATLEKPEASAVGIYTFDKYTYKQTFSAWGTLLDGKLDQSHPVFSFASVAFPVVVGKSNVVFAAAYQRLIDFYYQDEDTSWSEEEKGGVDAISPGIAIQVIPELSLGASVNIWTGHYDYKYTDKVNPTYNQDEKDFYKYSALNFNIGLMGHFEKAKIGAVLKTPVTIKEKYTNESGTDYTDEYKFPLVFGFGTSFMPNENLTLAVDYEIRPFSKIKFYDDSTDTEYDMDHWQDISQVRVGLEYLIVQDFGVLPVRLGFRTEPWIQKAWGVEKVTGLVFTGGLGVIVGNIWFDAAYELGLTEVKNDDDWDLDGIDDELEFKQTTHNIMLSAVVHFEPFR
ncbi:MAG: OmpP1/FadL family transporter [Candidatus Zixiibacteriota bacterium]